MRNKTDGIHGIWGTHNSATGMPTARALVPVPMLWAWLRRAAGGRRADGGMAVVDGL